MTHSGRIAPRRPLTAGAKPRRRNEIVKAHIRLARSSPGPVEADWQTDAYVAGRRRRFRAYNTEPKAGDDDMGESPAARAPSVAETTAATLIRDDRWPRWHEGAHHDAGGRVGCLDERVIWSPFLLQRRRRS